MELLKILIVLWASFILETQAFKHLCRREKDCENFCPMGYLIDSRGCVLCDRCVKVGMFESDIIVNGKSYGGLMDEYQENKKTSPEKRSAGDQKQWPKVGKLVEVPYVFSYMPSATRGKVEEARRIFHQRTCIRFVERGMQTNYVDFRGRGACSSSVGMVGGKQLVRLGPGCQKLGTVLHEMMHTLGFWHEQSRGDRDEHVDIVWKNILPGFEHNFLKRTGHWDSYGSRYDLRSVMQYGGYYLSVDEDRLPTIIDKSTKKPVVEQRDGFSEEDLHRINTKYGCTEYLNGARNRYTEARTPAKPTTSSPPCIDQDKSCAQYSAEHLCKVSSYVRNLCTKTCTKCEGPVATTTTAATTSTSTTTLETTTETTTPTTNRGQYYDNMKCMDHWKYCRIGALLGLCDGRYAVQMNSLCPASCRRCSLLNGAR